MLPPPVCNLARRRQHLRQVRGRVDNLLQALLVHRQFCGLRQRVGDGELDLVVQRKPFIQRDDIVLGGWEEGAASCCAFVCV